MDDRPFPPGRDVDPLLFKEWLLYLSPVGTEKYSFEWALFPLSEDGVHVDYCLSVDDFTPIAGRTYLPR